MFSKELEEVIEAALADGVITEKERAVLHKRALLEGIDPDELDVVIEGRLSKMKKEEDWLRPAPPQQVNNGKHGSVRKCPSCGAPVEAGTVKCAECGYAFVGIEANNSVTKLSEQLAKIENRFSNQGGDLGAAIGSFFGNSRHTTEVVSIISNFPVPTTKEDLLELILFVQPKTKHHSNESGEENKIATAYHRKYVECIEKAKIFFADDPQFQPLFEKYADSKKFRWRNLTPKQKLLTGVVIFYVVLILGLIIALL